MLRSRLSDGHLTRRVRADCLSRKRDTEGSRGTGCRLLMLWTAPPPARSAIEVVAAGVTRDREDVAYWQIVLQKSVVGGGLARPPGCGFSFSSRRGDGRFLSKPAQYAERAGGGAVTSLARRLRFWAMAASTNSSCAPRGPRRRSRPSRRMRFRCANLISMRLRSRRDCSKASVRQAIGRHRGRAHGYCEESCGPGSLGQHRAFSGQRCAVALAAAVEKRGSVIHEGAARRQGLPGRTDIGVGRRVVAEMLAREGTVLSLGLVDDGDVRRDLLVFDQPVQHRRRSIGGVRREPLRLETKSLLGALEHGPGRANLGLANGA